MFAGQPLYHIKDISKDDVQIGEEFPFSYDVSNNRIAVSVAIDGKIIEAASVSDVEEQYGVWMRGVYVKKKLVRQKLLDVQIGEGKVLESAKTQLIANTFPISSYCCENGYIEKVTFAPFSFKKAIVFQIVRVVNTGNEPMNYQAISSMTRLEGEECTNVQPGEDYIWVFAMSAEGEAKHILRDQQGKYMEPNKLFQDSLDIAQNRYGTFSVSDSYYNDAFIRMGNFAGNRA